MTKTTPTTWKSGDVILGQYEVMGILGQGGMGTVYQVHHRGWNIDLAVKTPKAEVFTTEGDKANFIREAQTWVNLTMHPNIVSCYYVRTIEEIPCLFAEYVPGGSLDSWIRSRRLYEGEHQQALARILDVSIQFAWGLHAAHEQGLVHQDVKPTNVMLTLDRSVKVTDFGLAQARAMTGVARPGATADQSILVSGGGMTPAYCSPEQATRQPLGRKTDIWSWAVSVLQMFVGAVTWLVGAAASGALANYLHQGAEDPRIPAMPADLADLLRHCFQPRPNDRPATMAEVAAALLEIYQREGGQSYPHAAPRPAQALAATLNNRALSLYDLGKIKEAKQVWAQALEADPRHPEATYNQGLILWREAELTDEALVHRLEEVRAAHPDQWQPVYLLALAHLERGERDTAFPFLEEAARRAPAETEVQALWEQVRLGTLLPDCSLSMFHEVFDKPEDRFVGPVSLSADGRRACLPGSRTTQVWEVATGRCLRIFQMGHMLVSLSADGRVALCGDYTGEMRVGDVATGKLLCALQGHTGAVNALSLSADGTVALSGSHDGTMRLWEVATGRCLRIFPHPKPVFSVSLSADGTVALSGSGSHAGSADGTMQVWEVATGECLRNFRPFPSFLPYLREVSLSADGTVALARFARNDTVLARDDAAQVWEVATRRCLRTFRFQTKARSVSPSADGCLVLVCDGGRTVGLWEVVTGRCLRTFQFQTSVTSASLSADGKTVLSRSENGTVQVCKLTHQAFLAPAQLSQIRSSRDLLRIEEQANVLLLQAEEAFGKARFATALDLLERVRVLPGWERSPRSRKIWAKLLPHCPKVRFRAGWLIETFPGHRDGVSSVSLSADGRLALFFGDDGKLQLWEVATGHRLRTFPQAGDRYSTCVLSADSRLALASSYDGGMRLWEIATGHCLRTFQEKADMQSIILSADGTVVLAGAPSFVHMGDVTTGYTLRLLHPNSPLLRPNRRSMPPVLAEGYEKRPLPLSLSADSKVALSGSVDGTVKVWEVATGKCLRAFQGHTRTVDALSLSADGNLALSGSHDGTMRLWEVSTGRCLRIFQASALSVSLSADGHWALSGSADATVRLWEVATGRCLYTFEGHTQRVRAVSLSADGHWALSGSADATVRLWELDWELEARDPLDWDEGASPILETFLSFHIPYVEKPPLYNTGYHRLTEQEIQRALTRRGKPSWTEQDFQDLIRQLQYAGYGWLRPEGVRHQLEKMAVAWPRRPRRISGQMDQEHKPASWWARLLRAGQALYPP